VSVDFATGAGVMALLLLFLWRVEPAPRRGYNGPPAYRRPAPPHGFVSAVRRPGRVGVI
jgi:hypothetical protein